MHTSGIRLLSFSLLILLQVSLVTLAEAADERCSPVLDKGPFYDAAVACKTRCAPAELPADDTLFGQTSQNCVTTKVFKSTAAIQGMACSGSSIYGRSNSGSTFADCLEAERGGGQNDERKRQEAKEDREKCDDALDELTEAKTELNTKCNALYAGAGTKQCTQNLEQCFKCTANVNAPGCSGGQTEEKTNAANVKFLKYQNCPALAAEDLKSAKDSKEKIEKELVEKQNKLQEKTSKVEAARQALEAEIAELQDQYNEAESDMETIQQEFTARLSDLSAEQRKRIEDIDAQVESAQQNLDVQYIQLIQGPQEQMSQMLAQVQATCEERAYERSQAKYNQERAAFVNNQVASRAQSNWWNSVGQTSNKRYEDYYQYYLKQCLTKDTITREQIRQASSATKRGEEQYRLLQEQVAKLESTALQQKVAAAGNSTSELTQLQQQQSTAVQKAYTKKEKLREKLLNAQLDQQRLAGQEGTATMAALAQLGVQVPNSVYSYASAQTKPQSKAGLELYNATREKEQLIQEISRLQQNSADVLTDYAQRAQVAGATGFSDNVEAGAFGEAAAAISDFRSKGTRAIRVCAGSSDSGQIGACKGAVETFTKNLGYLPERDEDGSNFNELLSRAGGSASSCQAHEDLQQCLENHCGTTGTSGPSFRQSYGSGGTN